MENYKNEYRKEEDELLWEIHEIRNKIHEEYNNITIEERNKNALAKFEAWKKERKLKKAIHG